jgi:hypothetical protein
VAIDRGLYVDEGLGKVTFGEWAAQYFTVASRRLARTSYARDLSYLNTYVIPRWGKVRIGRITKTEVERWVVELGADGRAAKGGSLSPATIEKIYQTFRKVMKAAYEEQRIPRLPCPARPPRHPRHRPGAPPLVQAERDPGHNRAPRGLVHERIPNRKARWRGNFGQQVESRRLWQGVQ